MLPVSQSTSEHCTETGNRFVKFQEWVPFGTEGLQEQEDMMVQVAICRTYIRLVVRYFVQTFVTVKCTFGS